MPLADAILPLVGIVGAGAMTGFFATWTSPVLPALDRTPPEVAVRGLTMASPIARASRS